MTAQPTPGRVDVLMFRIGRTRYGADASQVTRIDRAGADARLAHALDSPDEGQRALVFLTGDKESSLHVDEVEGVHRVPLEQLRRVPPAAGKAPGVIGLLLEEGGRAVVLVDLPTILEAPGGH